MSFLTVWLLTLWGVAARADDSYPFQNPAPFQANGVVTMVDGDRDRVNITTPDGISYSLDTDAADIRLRVTTKPGDTGDLVEGMRVSVVGRLLAPGIVAVDRLTVLPYTGTTLPYPAPSIKRAQSSNLRAGTPTPHPEVPRSVAESADVPGDHIHIRGTVQSVDDDAGIVTVDVNSHLRTIHVDDSTDLSAVPSTDDQHIGVQPGDPVNVSGTLLDDGSVNADAISPYKDQGDVGANVANTASQLVGHVSQESNKFTTRDIKVLIDASHEVTVHVPRDAHVTRNGMPVSVHDLKIDDLVKVRGSFDGDDFNATRIDVLQPASPNL
jgi:hypothetical protein